MGNWKMGFPNGLDGVVTYDSGEELYDDFGVLPITLDPTLICRAVGKVTNIASRVVTLSNINNYPNSGNTSFEPTNNVFVIDEYNGGFMRFLSGDCKDKVYKVFNTTLDTLESVTDYCTSGVSIGDVLEVVTGSSTFEFKLPRNPNRRDFKRQISMEAIRFPFYSGGLVVPIGLEPDDYVFSVNMTEEKDVDRLELFLNHYLDFKGFDGLYSTGYQYDNEKGLAPIILETGSNDIRNQFLATVEDYKIVKDAQRSDNFWEIMIHLRNYSKVLYRGI